jgi:hypothetical protein
MRMALTFNATNQWPCQHLADDLLPKLGVRASDCVRKIGTALSLLDRVSSCWWVCPGGGCEEHIVQYLAARGCNLGLASLRLTRFGFYDEALGLVRSMGEIANLLALFQLDKAAYEKWRGSDRETRVGKFGPGKVRKRIEALGGLPPMNEETYILLCERATHAVPGIRPQSYNVHGYVVPGGTFQEAALLMLINEIGAMASFILMLTAILTKIPSVRLSASIGGTSIMQSCFRIQYMDQGPPRRIQAASFIRAVGTPYNRALARRIAVQKKHNDPTKDGRNASSAA